MKKDESPMHENQIQLFKKNSIDKDILKLKDIGRRTTFRYVLYSIVDVHLGPWYKWIKSSLNPLNWHN